MLSYAFFLSLEHFGQYFFLKCAKVSKSNSFLQSGHIFFFIIIIPTKLTLKIYVICKVVIDSYNQKDNQVYKRKIIILFMEYFFVFGRNPTLSYAELISYLKSHGIAYKILSFKQNFLVLSVGEGIKFNVQDFGGVLRIGKANKVKNQKELDKLIIDYFMMSEKFSYSVISNADQEIISDIEDKLQEKFKKEKLKAQVRHGNAGKIKMQEGEDFEMSKSDVEFFYYEDEKDKYFGGIDQKYSYKDVKERDMQKPVRREALAISPRLAKILINLSQVREGELLVDPFCGIGVIIQEAVLKGINCFGVDKDKYAIEDARKNMEWISSKYKVTGNARFYVGNSAKMPHVKIYGVATEPALGELVKKKILDAAAGNYIKQFENLIVPILQRIKDIKVPHAKVVLTMPFIRQFSVNIERVARMSNMSVYKLDDKITMPIKEVREEQYVGREIVILE